jgi:hypothetical protein
MALFFSVTNQHLSVGVANELLDSGSTSLYMTNETSSARALFKQYVRPWFLGV